MSGSRTILADQAGGGMDGKAEDLGRAGVNGGVREGKRRWIWVGLGGISGYMQGGLQWSQANAGMRVTDLGRVWWRARKWAAAEESGEVLSHLVVGVPLLVVEWG